MRTMVRVIGAPVLVALLLMCLPVAAWAQKADTAPGWLGVSIQDLTGELRDALPRGVSEGAIINDVMEGSPAEAGGLKEGDIITRLGQETIKESDDLTRAVRDAGAGEKVRIEYYRDGRRMRTDVTLGERDLEVIAPRAERMPSDVKRWKNRKDGEAPRARRQYRDAMRWLERDGDEPEVFYFDDDHRGFAHLSDLFGGKGRLGVHLMDLGDQLATYFRVSEDSGPLVTEVVEESPAEAAGLKAGDVITRVGAKAVEDAGDVRAALREFDEGGDVEIEVVRDGRRQTLTARLEKAERPSGRAFGYMHRPEIPHIEKFEIPKIEWDRGEIEAQMKELRKELEELRRELRRELRGRP